MERALSQEERIKRAEEIYYRRQNAINLPKTATVNIMPKKNYRLLKKVFVQIIICVGIYSVIYKLQENTDNISVDSIEYLRSAISYDVDLNKALENAKNYISTFNFPNKEVKQDENNIRENAQIENVQEQNTETQEVTLSATSEQEQEENPQTIENMNDLGQMEIDAQYIKNNFSLIKPVDGPITSRFGPRNPTTETVPKYHTGIDIGVSTGTTIIASMEGEVVQVSSVGDYRKSY